MPRKQHLHWIHGLSAAIVMAGALGCDVQAPPPPLDDPSASQFRCAALAVPGVGGLQTVTINGSAAIVGVGVDFDVFSNGPIQVAGTAAVSGGAYSVNSSIDLFDTATVTGLPGPDATRTGEVPNWVPTGAVDWLNINHDNAAIPTTTNGQDPVVNGDTELVLFGGDSVTLPPGYYAFDSISISGGSTLEFAGGAYVALNGAMSVSGGSQIVVGDPRNVLFIAPNTDAIDISEGSQVSLRLYAPNAPVTVSGTGTRFNGGLLGGTLQLSGSTQMEVTEDALHIWRTC